MKIKQLIPPDEKLEQEFQNFCFKSKPYDFCSIKSRTLRNAKITEYLYELYTNSSIYCIEIDDKRAVTCFFSSYPDSLVLEFIFGNFGEFNSTELINATHEILKHVLKEYDLPKAVSLIKRKHKKREYLRWIKKYDKKCEIIEDPVNIEDTQIIWTYERLS